MGLAAPGARQSARKEMEVFHTNPEARDPAKWPSHGRILLTIRSFLIVVERSPALSCMNHPHKPGPMRVRRYSLGSPHYVLFEGERDNRFEN